MVAGEGRLPAGWYYPSFYALKDSRTQPEALKKGVELAGGTCSKGIISAFFLTVFFIASQLLKNSWRSSESGRDSAILLLQHIPRRRETRRGKGRPHTLRYCCVFLRSHLCNLSAASQSTLQGLGQCIFAWVVCPLEVIPLMYLHELGLKLKIPT